MPDIYDTFTATAAARGLIAPGDAILLSMSAGKDSMAMLDLMLRCRDEYDIRLGIFHLNHLTRGAESDSDETLVRDKAAALGIQFFSRKFDFKKDEKKGISFEEHAREVRYSLLEEIAAAENFKRIATAHNSRDNVETLLMRIFTGTGIFGLRGIPYISGKIIRPMLDISPDEIYSYLKERNIIWREDESNSDIKYLRNYVRNILIPAVTERFPEAEESIVNLAGHADENESLLSFLADVVNPGWLAVTENGHFIKTAQFSDNIPFVKYLLSRTLLSEYGIRLNSSIHTEIFRRFTSPRSNVTLYEKEGILVEKILRDNVQGITVSRLAEINCIPDRWGYRLQLKDKCSFFISELKMYINYRRSGFTEFSARRVEQGLVFISIPENAEYFVIRNRLEGDRIYLEKGSKKIKDLLIEKKLDTSRKKIVPLIVIDNRIAAFLPGAVKSYPDRVSCNFWVDDLSNNMFVFNFSDSPDFNTIEADETLFREQ